jgi:hypothetical protein
VARSRNGLAVVNRHADAWQKGGDPVIKKGLTWLLVAFVIYYVVSEPDSAASNVRWAGQNVQNAAQSLVTFFHGVAAR